MRLSYSQVEERWHFCSHRYIPQFILQEHGIARHWYRLYSVRCGVKFWFYQSSHGFRFIGFHYYFYYFGQQLWDHSPVLRICRVKMVRYLRFQFNRFHRAVGSLRFQFNKFHRVLGRTNSLDAWPRNNDATPIQTHRFQSVWKHLRGSTGGHQAWKPNLGSMTASRVTRVSRTSKEVWLPKEGGWRATILKVLRSKTTAWQCSKIHHKSCKFPEIRLDRLPGDATDLLHGKSGLVHVSKFAATRGGGSINAGIRTILGWRWV